MTPLRPLALGLALWLPNPISVVAQFEGSAGPAYRYHTTSLAGPRAGGWDGMSAEVNWGGAFVGRLGFLVGVGAFWGSSTAVDAGCPAPGLGAPCNPSPDRGVSGWLVTARVGVRLERGRASGSVGAIIGHTDDPIDPTGAGPFAEFRVRPLARLPELSIGLLGYRLGPAPGHQRALLVPGIGWRF